MKDAGSTDDFNLFKLFQTQFQRFKQTKMQFSAQSKPKISII